MKKTLFRLGIFIIIVTAYLYAAEYRFTPLSAVKANSFVPKNIVLLDQVDYDWGTVFIFDSKRNPVTVVSFRQTSWLWLANVVNPQIPREDPVRTMGRIDLAREKEKATVMSIIVDDPKVTSIEIGPAEERESKTVKTGQIVTFSWDKWIDLEDLHPLALDNEGKVKYEYRYAQRTTFDEEKLRWYPVDMEYH